MPEHEHDIDGKAGLGIGFWLLLCTFAVRAVSTPPLLATTVLVALSIPIVVIGLAFSLIGCADVSSTADVVSVFYHF